MPCQICKTANPGVLLKLSQVRRRCVEMRCVQIAISFFRRILSRGCVQKKEDIVYVGGIDFTILNVSASVHERSKLRTKQPAVILVLYSKQIML
jgi:hypothetical protein